MPGAYLIVVSGIQKRLEVSSLAELKVLISVYVV
jgi:hypothetical protein